MKYLIVFVIAVLAGVVASEEFDEENLRRFVRYADQFAEGGPTPSSKDTLQFPSGKNDRGSWSVTLDQDKGIGPQVRTDVERNVYTSRNGNWKVDVGGHHEAGRGRKPDYDARVTATGRFRREADPQSKDNKDRGSWSVTVNKDKGRGPQIRTEADRNVYTSRNGNWRVDVGGHHEAGRGRKPDYGVRGTISGRWRREADPQSNGNKDRGSWSVTVNKDKGSGPQIRTEADRNVYTSRNGNWRVDVGGHHEAGRGRKPDYGAHATVSGRWKREADPQSKDHKERGNWSVTVNKDKGRGPQIRTEADRNVYTSRNGNWRVDVGGHHEAGRGRKPDYGAHATVSGRWKREADPQNKDHKGSVSITREQTRGQKPVYTGTVNGRVWQSHDKRGKVDIQGHYQTGGGRRPSYGGMVTYTRRFRRDIDDDNELVSYESYDVMQEENQE